MRIPRQPALVVPPKPEKPLAYQAIDTTTNDYIGTLIGSREAVTKELRDQGILNFRLEKVDPIVW